MGRAEDIIKAYEAWDPNQESSTALANRLGISKARLYQILDEEDVTPKARRPHGSSLSNQAMGGRIARAVDKMPTGLEAGVSLTEARDARQELQYLLDEVDALRIEVAEYRKRYGPLE